MSGTIPGADWREDTITSFPAIRDDTPPPQADGKCQCGMASCPDGPDIPHPADVRVVLSCAEGVVSRIWRAKVASGEWDDIPAFADQGHARVHLPALNANRRIRANVAAGRHDIGTVLRADPPALDDPQLDRDLCRVEDRIAGEAAALRRWVAERAAQIRDETGTEVTA